MTPTPLVSVVIPTFNRPEQLAAALASVAAQNAVPGPMEAIVVNDGGTDVRAVIDSARDRGLAVRLIDLPANRGLPSARNVGIDTARGEFLALLDDDDVYLPDHLATMLTAIDHEHTDAAYGICHTSTTWIDPSMPLELPAYRSLPFDADLLAVANFIPVHTAVFRMPPPAARYDTTLPALEDWDMWLRLVREHGYRFHHVPQPTVIYHRIPDSGSMCATTVSATAGLAGFGRLVQRIWSRWPATTTESARFRLYIAVLYWNALTVLTEGRRLAEDYFQCCVADLAAAWHGDEPENDLPARIITTIEDGSRADTAA